MRRALLWSFGTLFALVTVAVAALLLVDFSRYRPALEAQASAALGRTVVIAGTLDIKVSLTPTLAATDVTIANAPGGSRDQMARIGRLEIGLDLLPLLESTVNITRIVLRDADIHLEHGADGRGNWLFEPTSEAAGPPDAQPPSGGGNAPEGGALPFIGLLDLRDSVISHTGMTGRTRRLDIARARLATPSENDDIAVDFAGLIDGQPFEGAATTGPLSSVMNVDRDWPMRLALAMGDSRVSVAGTVTDTATFRHYQMAVEAHMASIDPIGAVLGRALPAIPAFTVKADVAGQGDDIRLSGLSGTLGDSDIAGDVVLTLAGDRPRIAGTLAARRWVLADLPRDGSGSSMPDPNATPAPVLPVAALDAVDLDLRLRVDELALNDFSVTEIQGVISLQDRQLQVAVEQATLFDGALTGALRVDAGPQPATAAVDARIDQIDIGTLLRDMAVSDAIVAHADASVAMQADGATVPQMIASADGRVTVNVGPGRINNAMASMVGRGLLTALLPVGQTDTVALHCAIGNFDMVDGVATSTALLVDSQRATIAGTGRIDLAGRRLDLVFNPRSKDPNLLALVAPVRVHGAIDAPDVSVLAGEMLTDAATGLLLGAINPLAIVIPFVTAGDGNRNACLAAINDEMAPEHGAAERGVAGRLVDGAAGAVGGVAEGAAGIVGGVVGGVVGGAGDAAAGVGGALGTVGRGIGGALGGLFGGDDTADPPAEDP